jgi:hypothetical protein
MKEVSKMPIIKFNNYKEPGISKEVLEELQVNLLKMVFPVGSTYITQTAINPANEGILGFGTWERLKGRVCVGLDENDTAFNKIGQTGGEKEHTLTIKEIPSHNHSLSETYYGLVSGGGSQEFGSGASRSSKITMNNTGGNQPHNNLQPYQVVGYMWIRIN